MKGGPGPVFEESDEYWIALSGVPSPDLNLTLVSGGGASTVDRVLARLDEVGVPTLTMLTGSCQAMQLGPPWQHLGEMPFMATRLDAERLRSDPRVRQAVSDDREVVCAVMGEAFGLATDLLRGIVAGTLDDPDGAAKIWLLEEDRVAVSAVLTMAVEDAVTVWCMSTPERFGRRGYGRALLADALARAAADGATVGLLGATPAGKPLYEATGWVTLEQWKMFASVESAQFEA